jgi:hypothetical protein
MPLPSIFTTRAIRDSDIAKAIELDELDDACRYLMEIAGISTGDVAGMCFGNLDFNCAKADAAERERHIRSWLRTERQYAAM